ncbi:ABC transporter ATP-binding protein [Amycolatopsis rhabdoformis]|uniref:ABC transporter ATP-binding protein n=1 Tax=Amycolatopsis rhabdoformis TaxID=1448059 RepID=A0ABZ1IBC2_9PSEU|nr:ABC transporter ATP-binding protein [Amycolatopsis rhabdoformis]WSE31707.1 ABC transporter ATP-binding protein [Amycolatopsis rhabdoformis]
MSAPTACIEIEHVSKRYQRPGRKAESFLAVSDVHFDIRQGEFISLIGASGCGKTTLLRMMSGLIPVDDGQIRINGDPVRGVPGSIGFVFQEPALLPWKTVRENMAFALKAKELPPEEVDAAIAAKLEMTSLQDFAGYYPSALSGGMQQRAGLARALACDPDVLFMDEPLSALDAFTRRRLQQDIATIIEGIGATTVLVTHDVDEAVFFSDRIVVMGTSPGSVRDVVEVPFPKPRRHAELLGDPEVAKLRDHVLGIVLGLH